VTVDPPCPERADRSIVSLGCVGSPMLRLFCFPYAGGSASGYAGWHEALPRVDVCAIELPGRGALFNRPPLRRLPEMVAYAVAAVQRRLDMPFALYGHSMGAVTVLEVARELSRLGTSPTCLIVSGCCAPHLPSRRPFLLHTLTRDRLLEELNRLEGLPDALLRKPDLLDAFLPTIRADLESRETWRSEVSPIDVPITAIGGKEDGFVSLDELRAWEVHTSAGFSMVQMDGGHFFIKSHQDELLARLHEALSSSLKDTRAGKEDL
jgi:surfactin synthase thioesterase subunit